jgi:hypothetical protein
MTRAGRVNTTPAATPNPVGAGFETRPNREPPYPNAFFKT